MKKILLLLLVSFIAKPDYDSLGLSYGTTGDVDILGLGYESVTEKFAFSALVGNVDSGFGDATVTGLSLDYAFGNFNEGSFFVGVTYTRASSGGESDSDSVFNLGYGKASGEGLDWGVSIDSEEQDLTLGVTRWFEDGLGIGAGVTILEEDELFQISAQYKW